MNIMEQALFSDPRFDALRNALYHTERRNFLDLLNRFLSFLVIMLGTGVVAKIADTNGWRLSYMELGVVFFATAQLVFDFGGRARTHDFLQRRYYETLSEIEENGIRSDDDKLKFSARLAVICSEEPMTMRAVDAIAYNKAVDATIADPEHRKRNRLKLTHCQRFFRHVCPFQNADFAPDAA